MAFDISAITGAVNNYLGSISDTSKLLAQKESENAFDTDLGLSGLFEKYLNKAISDETGKKLENVTDEDAAKELVKSLGLPENEAFVYTKEDVAPTRRAAEANPPQRVDTSIPFPKFDIGSMIADNIASHNRFNTDTFSDVQHTAQREISAKGIDPYYSNMIKSSIKESDT
ncbi:MAG: hypothetical protein IKO84_09330 [Butyrivibrio sp.]|nr:hypothetical protein [Butyrivibrio sp.]